MNKIVIIGLIAIFFSCKKEVKPLETTKEAAVSIQNDTIIGSKVAIADSSKFIDDWAEIFAFEEELKKLSGSKNQSENDIEILKKLLAELKKTNPERFKVPAIEARIKVLETEILMLDQDLKSGVSVNMQARLFKIKKNYSVFVGQIEALITKEKDYEKYN